MKVNLMRKTLIFLMIFSALLYVGTFLRFDKVFGNPYDQYYIWNGFDLDYAPLNPEAIHFESDYVPFFEIMDIEDASSIDVTKKYVIESAYELYRFSVLASGEDDDIYLSLHYVLGQHIDYYKALQMSIEYLFIPIGFNQPFTGTFDGQGYEITNLIFRPTNTVEEYDTYMPGLIYLSMFSKISPTGVVKNFGLINPLIIQALEQGVMTHVSVIAGENSGTIENVYYIDLREESAGINAEGNFYISGLVSRNIGTFKNSYLVTPYVKSRAISSNLSTYALVYDNQGVMQNIYYDENVLLDEDAIKNASQGLTTFEFQDDSIFNSKWYFATSYTVLADQPSLETQFILDHKYPILQGLDIENDHLIIRDAVDFVYMNQLFQVSGQFRAQDYLIVQDIDMNQVSKTAYKASNTGFNGSLSSEEITSSQSTLYDRNSSQGGDITHHTIIDLKIESSTFIGNFASYAIFSSLFGSVSNLNIYNLNIRTEDIDQTFERTKILIGSIAGQMNHAIIENVHVDVNVDVLESSSNLGQLLIGGIAGEGSATLVDVSTTGTLNPELQNYNIRSNQSAVAGIIAKSSNVSLSKVISSIDVRGLSYQNSYTGTTYVSGMIGYGSLKSVYKTVYIGDVLTYENGFVDTIYTASMFAYITDVIENITYVYNDGDITTHINQSINLYQHGVGLFSDLDDDLVIQSMTNNGLMTILGNDLNEGILTQINVYASGVLSIANTEAELYGIYHTKDQNQIDLALVNTYSGILSNMTNHQITATKLYQMGDLELTSQFMFTKQSPKVSGVVLGNQLTLTHLRQEGDITLNFNHHSQSFLSATFMLYGMIENVDVNQKAKDILNLGDLNVIKNSSVDISYDLYISGIMGYHKNNQNIYNELNISHNSINISGENGYVDNLLNDGDIYVRGNFNGHVRVAGIVLFNRSLITNAINLGDIDIVNHAITNNDEVEAAGIAYLMSGEYAQLKDTANNGDIRAISNSTFGFAHAAGIALRNDRNEIGANLTANTHDNERAKITFSINYGNIYAFSGTNESSYTITSETRSKASGIFAIGMLSAINNINYGNVYSKYLAAGIIGFIYFNRFGTVNPNEVYISNSMNYGKIRQITGYNSVDDTLIFNTSQTPPTSTIYAFGAIVGKFHTNTTTWQFVGNTNYPIDLIYFGYLLNFDEKINMFARAPQPDASNFYNSEELIDTFDQVISGMLANMATTNPNDNSVPPFTQFTILIYIWIFPIERQFGEDIKSYELNDLEDGIFYETFGFRSARPVFGSTDQYIRDYIQYLPREKINESILSKLESDSNNIYTGIYALSSSKGIGNGIFIPDAFDTTGLNLFVDDDPIGDDSWLGNSLTPGDVSHSLYHLMRQIKSVFATTIYDLEIKQVDAFGNYLPNGLTLANPVIDEARGLLTYYIPSNASIFGSGLPDVMTVSKYVEVSPGIEGARYVPNLLGSGAPTYKWVGTHKKVGDQMVAIGPYAELSGQQVYNVTRSTVYDSYSSSNLSNLNPPLYDYTTTNDSIGADVIDEIVEFAGYTSTRFLIWLVHEMEGYPLSSVSTAGLGQGAYIRYRQDGYNRDLYSYVGPNTENITYVNAGLTPNVSIFPESDKYFRANNDPETFVISDGASLTYQGQSVMTNISIPRSFGIYDQMYDSQGNYLDSVEDHYGQVRVFSQAYDPNDAATYKDYTIRVIRTADQEISDIEALLINQTPALPVSYNVENVTANQDLYYEYDGLNGMLSFTYETFNISDIYYMAPNVEIFDNYTNVKVTSSLYRLEKGFVETDGIFNNLTGAWGYGSVTIDVVPEDDFPSGDYRIETTLITGDVYRIFFSKIESGGGAVLSMTHNDIVINPESNLYVTSIPYGIYYQASNVDTFIVDFTNLDQITNLYYLDVSNQLPSYLQGLEISTFATIDYIDLVVTQLEGYRYQYDIIYHIIAEDNSTHAFTHRLVERPLNASVQVAYKNGGELDLPLSIIDIFYEEGPTLRMEYDFDDVHFATDDILSITSDFTPLDGIEEAFENIDYFITPMNGIGYEVDLNRDIPKGDYEFMLNYHQEITMWGQTFVWDFDFDMMYATKLKNDNAHLQNILFATNSVFDEVIDAFSTIIEIDPITVADYEGYYVFPIENRTQRIINVLPTTGIDYGNYDNYQAYWILGQVQRTNLASYTPTFFVPDGASIYKVVDQTNLHYSYQSSELTADYSDFGDGVNFSFIQYRVYAEDFDENNDHYIDYYVTVQDTTNNVKIDITVVNDTFDFIEDVFVTVNVCRIEEGESCDLDHYLLSMHLFSYFNQEQLRYINLPFATSTDGVYKITADLPDGYDFYIEASQELISGDYLNIPSSRIPQRYFITIHIVEGNVLDKLWGYDETYYYAPVALPLDELKTYTEYERFIYEGITYMVQPGFTYLYQEANKPGTSHTLGLLNTNKIYDPYSTYINGNTVYYMETYYKALDVVASGVTPNITSVSNGLWFELSENWLSYNHYQAGDITYYSGTYYIALTDNQGYLPSSNPVIWQVYNN